MAGSGVATGASRREAVTERNSRWPWPPLAFVVGCMKSFYYYPMAKAKYQMRLTKHGACCVFAAKSRRKGAPVDNPAMIDLTGGESDAPP